jgi:hypothetical protein
VKVNYAELTKGKDCQLAAFRAFNLDDLHNAYTLYAEAEAHYRTAFDTPGDLVFLTFLRFSGHWIKRLGALPVRV